MLEALHADKNKGISENEMDIKARKEHFGTNEKYVK